MKVLTMLLGLLFSVCVLMGCNNSTKDTTQDHDKTEQLGQVPDKTAQQNCGNDTVTVAAPTGSKDAESLKEQQAPGSNEANDTATSNLQKLLEGAISSSYKTPSGRKFNRTLIDFLQEGSLVAFHATYYEGRLILLFEMGQDISDTTFEEAIMDWEEISTDSFTILVHPGCTEITHYPMCDAIIVKDEDGKARGFSKAIIRREGSSSKPIFKL